MKAIIIILFAALCMSCEYNKTVESEILYEDATVIHKLYSPSDHRTTISPKLMSIGGSGSPIGVGFDGPGFSTGGMVISDSYVPEKWGLVFKCNHGSFTIEGSREINKQMYESFNENDKVNILYREVYREHYNSKDSLLNRYLIDLDFIEARKNE